MLTKLTKRAKRTRRLRIAAVALAVAGVGAACAPAPPPPPPPAAASGCSGPAGPPSSVTSTVFNLTNSSRAAAGVHALAWNPQLWCLANEWSNNMAAQGRMYHRDLGAVLRTAPYSGYRTLGENVLYGPASMSGEDMHNAWMGSAGHRANILSGAFTSFAVATAYSGSTVWATENFGG